jgi:hypothetical protein
MSCISLKHFTKIGMLKNPYLKKVLRYEINYPITEIHNSLNINISIAYNIAVY